jgi:hypothetical protein
MRRVLVCASLLLVFAVAPTVAKAELRTFLDTDDIFPPGNGTFGPATVYPATIEVEEVPGTVAGVDVTLIDIESAEPDDMDIALRGPNGKTVMLVSDACGEMKSIAADDWVIEDAAPTFISDNGPCASDQTAHFKPSNYFGGMPEPDNMAVDGGPFGPYLNELGFLAEGSPDGPWELFALDDSSAVTGLFLGGWALTLEVEPPPPPPSPPPVVVMGPPAPAPAPLMTATVVARATGKRAAALAKCKTKKAKKSRAACRAKARKLPV